MAKHGSANAASSTRPLKADGCATRFRRCGTPAEAAARLGGQIGQRIDIEAETSHAAADVIFRTLFSIPIEHEVAARVFDGFRAYQRDAADSEHCRLYSSAALGAPVPSRRTKRHRRRNPRADRRQ